MPGSQLPKVPEGLRDLMKSLTKEVLREKPTDLYEFSAQFFESLVNNQKDFTVKEFEPISEYDFLKNRERNTFPAALIYSIIPIGLTELIKDFIKAVLRQRPENICTFGVEYFRRLEKIKKNERIDYLAFEKNKDQFSFTPYMRCTCGGYKGISSAYNNNNEEVVVNNVGKHKNCLINDEFTHLNGNEEVVKEHQTKITTKSDSVFDEKTIKAVYIIQKFCRHYVIKKKAEQQIQNEKNLHAKAEQQRLVLNDEHIIKGNQHSKEIIDVAKNNLEKNIRNLASDSTEYNNRKNNGKPEEKESLTHDNEKEPVKLDQKPEIPLNNLIEKVTEGDYNSTTKNASMETSNETTEETIQYNEAINTLENEKNYHETKDINHTHNILSNEDSKLENITDIKLGEQSHDKNANTESKQNEVGIEEHHSNIQLKKNLSQQSTLLAESLNETIQETETKVAKENSINNPTEIQGSEKENIDETSIRESQEAKDMHTESENVYFDNKNKGLESSHHDETNQNIENSSTFENDSENQVEEISGDAHNYDKETGEKILTTVTEKEVKICETLSDEKLRQDIAKQTPKQPTDEGTAIIEVNNVKENHKNEIYHKKEKEDETPEQTVEMGDSVKNILSTDNSDANHSNDQELLRKSTIDKITLESNKTIDNDEQSLTTDAVEEQSKMNTELKEQSNNENSTITQEQETPIEVKNNDTKQTETEKDKSTLENEQKAQLIDESLSAKGVKHTKDETSDLEIESKLIEKAVRSEFEKNTESERNKREIKINDLSLDETALLENKDVYAMKDQSAKNVQVNDEVIADSLENNDNIVGDHLKLENLTTKESSINKIEEKPKNEERELENKAEMQKVEKNILPKSHDQQSAELKEIDERKENVQENMAQSIEDTVSLTEEDNLKTLQPKLSGGSKNNNNDDETKDLTEERKTLKEISDEHQQLESFSELSQTEPSISQNAAKSLDDKTSKYDLISQEGVMQNVQETKEEVNKSIESDQIAEEINKNQKARKENEENKANEKKSETLSSEVKDNQAIDLQEPISIQIKQHEESKERKMEPKESFKISEDKMSVDVDDQNDEKQIETFDMSSKENLADDKPEIESITLTNTSQEVSDNIETEKQANYHDEHSIETIKNEKPKSSRIETIAVKEDITKETTSLNKEAIESSKIIERSSDNAIQNANQQSSIENDKSKSKELSGSLEKATSENHSEQKTENAHYENDESASEERADSKEWAQASEERNSKGNDEVMTTDPLNTLTKVESQNQDVTKVKERSEAQQEILEKDAIESQREKETQDAEKEKKENSQEAPDAPEKAKGKSQDEQIAEDIKKDKRENTNKREVLSSVLEKSASEHQSEKLDESVSVGNFKEAHQKGSRDHSDALEEENRKHIKTSEKEENKSNDSSEDLKETQDATQINESENTDNSQNASDSIKKTASKSPDEEKPHDISKDKNPIENNDKSGLENAVSEDRNEKISQDIKENNLKEGNENGTICRSDVLEKDKSQVQNETAQNLNEKSEDQSEDAVNDPGKTSSKDQAEIGTEDNGENESQTINSAKLDEDKSKDSIDSEKATAESHKVKINSVDDKEINDKVSDVKENLNTPKILDAGESVGNKNLREESIESSEKVNDALISSEKVANIEATIKTEGNERNRTEKVRDEPQNSADQHHSAEKENNISLHNNESDLTSKVDEALTEVHIPRDEGEVSAMEHKTRLHLDNDQLKGIPMQEDIIEKDLTTTSNKDELLESLVEKEKTLNEINEVQKSEENEDKEGVQITKDSKEPDEELNKDHKDKKSKENEDKEGVQITKDSMEPDEELNNNHKDKSSDATLIDPLFSRDDLPQKSVIGKQTAPNISESCNQIEGKTETKANAKKQPTNLKQNINTNRTNGTHEKSEKVLKSNNNNLVTENKHKKSELKNSTNSKELKKKTIDQKQTKSKELTPSTENKNAAEKEKPDESESLDTNDANSEIKKPKRICQTEGIKNEYVEEKYIKYPIAEIYLKSFRMPENDKSDANKPLNNEVIYNNDHKLNLKSTTSENSNQGNETEFSDSLNEEPFERDSLEVSSSKETDIEEDSLEVDNRLLKNEHQSPQKPKAERLPTYLYGIKPPPDLSEISEKQGKIPKAIAFVIPFEKSPKNSPKNNTTLAQLNSDSNVAENAIDQEENVGTMKDETNTFDDDRLQTIFEQNENESPREEENIEPKFESVLNVAESNTESLNNKTLIESEKSNFINDDPQPVENSIKPKLEIAEDTLSTLSDNDSNESSTFTTSKEFDETVLSDENYNFRENPEYTKTSTRDRHYIGSADNTPRGGIYEIDPNNLQQALEVKEEFNDISVVDKAENQIEKETVNLENTSLGDAIEKNDPKEMNITEKEIDANKFTTQVDNIEVEAESLTKILKNAKDLEKTIDDEPVPEILQVEKQPKDLAEKDLQLALEDQEELNKNSTDKKIEATIGEDSINLENIIPGKDEIVQTHSQNEFNEMNMIEEFDKDKSTPQSENIEVETESLSELLKHAKDLNKSSDAHPDLTPKLMESDKKKLVHPQTNEIGDKNEETDILENRNIKPTSGSKQISKDEKIEENNDVVEHPMGNIESISGATNIDTPKDQALQVQKENSSEVIIEPLIEKENQKDNLPVEDTLYESDLSLKHDAVQEVNVKNNTAKPEEPELTDHAASKNTENVDTIETNNGETMSDSNLKTQETNSSKIEEVRNEDEKLSRQNKTENDLSQMANNELKGIIQALEKAPLPPQDSPDSLSRKSNDSNEILNSDDTNSVQNKKVNWYVGEEPIISKQITSQLNGLESNNTLDTHQGTKFETAPQINPVNIGFQTNNDEVVNSNEIHKENSLNELKGQEKNVSVVKNGDHEGLDQPQESTTDKMAEKTGEECGDKRVDTLKEVTKEESPRNEEDEIKRKELLKQTADFIHSQQQWNSGESDKTDAKTTEKFCKIQLTKSFLESEIEFNTYASYTEVIEEVCIKKSVSQTNIDEIENEGQIKNDSTKPEKEAQTKDDLKAPENIVDTKDDSNEPSQEMSLATTAAASLQKSEEFIEKVQRRRSLELESVAHKSEKSFEQASFDEPVIKTLESIVDSRNSSAEDTDEIVIGKTTTPIGNNIEYEQKATLKRLHTIAGDDTKMLFKSVTIDEAVQYIEITTESETAATSMGSISLDEDTSENIRKKMMAYSLSEDSDQYEPKELEVPPRDDFNINTALEETQPSSTETESTIVSAATKIQAGARGFLTRRRLRRSTKSPIHDSTKDSFGNNAISESLEMMVENAAAKKIQNAYRNHRKSQTIAIPPRSAAKHISHENSLAVKRMTLQRGDALRNNSSPEEEDEGSNANNTNSKIENAASEIKIIEAENATSSSKKAKAKTKSDTKSSELRWLTIRQNSMPVQIDCEVFRVIPKHMRKRINSAEVAKKRGGRRPQFD